MTIEAVMIWNEPNNKAHWDFELDPEWRIFARMACQAAQAIEAENPKLPRILGGISPIDPNFVSNMRRLGVLDHVDIVAVHAFPLTWSDWPIRHWPRRLTEIQAIASRPVWI